MRKIIYHCAMTAILIFAIVVLCWNIVKNPNFMRASISQVLTLFATIFITFLAVQLRNDERKQKEHVEDILADIQEKILAEPFNKIDTNTNTKLITLTNRSISNKMNTLEGYCHKFKFVEEMNYIKNKLQDYKEFVDGHITDLEYLEKSNEELIKYSESISSKCDAIRQKIYK